jgi:hypothetical protein
MNRKCPNCNVDKTPQKELTREGLKKKFVAEIRRDNEIKFLMTEYKEIREELHEANAQLKKDVKEYIEKRKIELNIPEKRNYFLTCITAVHRRARSLAKEKGPEYVGAINSDRKSFYGIPIFEYNFFGKEHAYINRRLKFPYLRLQL